MTHYITALLIHLLLIISDQTLISVPAPGGGPVILSIMNILEGYNFKSGDKNQTKTVHRILEVCTFK